MKILGIDTSCDDTCVSLIEIRNPKFEIRSNIISSQVKLHAKYGGVYPALAKREHQKNLPIVFKKATKEIDISEINFIGVTVGPGLEPCLWQGINFAKELAKKYNKTIIPVNHIEAHILANFIGENPKSEIQNSKQILNSKFQNSKLFPAVCLVVSGGHTQLILMKDIGKYKLIGETRDDAAGECFDKVARILGLGYPGGPAIAKEGLKFSRKININKYTPDELLIKLPRPMMYTKDYDFSFSGLKTAVLYNFKSQTAKVRKSKEYIRKMAYEVQQAIIDVLIYKTLRAAKNYKAKSIILGGGVAANNELRKQFNWKLGIGNWKLDFLVPPKIFCTDNGAMVAVTAYFHRKEASKNWQKVKANSNLKI